MANAHVEEKAQTYKRTKKYTMIKIICYIISFIAAIILIGYAIVITGHERSPYLRRKNHEFKRTQKTP